MKPTQLDFLNESDKERRRNQIHLANTLPRFRMWHVLSGEIVEVSARTVEAARHKLGWQKARLIIEFRGNLPILSRFKRLGYRQFGKRG